MIRISYCVLRITCLAESDGDMRYTKYATRNTTQANSYRIIITVAGPKRSSRIYYDPTSAFCWISR